MLRVNDIFTGVSGECGGFDQGSWTTFIRFDGCNLRCPYCDTADTQKGNKHREMIPGEMYRQAVNSGCSQFLLTGGEPLIQPADSLAIFCSMIKRRVGASIQVETNGSLFPSEDLLTFVDHWVVDYKMPSSGNDIHMLPLEKVNQFPKGSWLKFVVEGFHDYRDAITTIQTLKMMNTNLHFAMSAVERGNSFNYDMLFHWMQEDKLHDVLFNTQIHKLANLSEKTVR